MAFIYSSSSVVKLDNSAGTPVTITQYVTDVNFDRVVAMLDTTVLGATSPTFITGLLDGDEISLNLLWDDTIETQIQSLIGLATSSTFEVAPAGTATGKRRVYCEVWVKKVGRPMKAGEKIVVPVTLQKTGAVTETVY